ncbi:ion channel protein [Herbiconiux sp.]|uniref:ion channel protein n=1 Tax=Herbiconiux sp. TaxID=1871186 RepID=UPI0025BC1425|nr:ion channel protein [Herbiconiux sp.]
MAGGSAGGAGGADSGAGAASGAGPGAGAPTTRRQLILAVPALLIGVLSALVLFALDELSELLEHGIWSSLPAAVGLDPSSGWFIFAVLSLTGLAIGLVVRFVPGHGGRDSAATDLISAPQPLKALPSLALVAVLGLAGGVSLGPESPIIAINSGLFVAIMARFLPKVPPQLTVMLAAAGTVGALFGTPVAAALILTGVVAALPTGGELWDRLFLPLVAAGAGSLTMTLLAHPTFELGLPVYDTVAPIDILSAAGIASVAALAGIGCILLFRMLHPLFHRIGNPVLYITLGGMVLGVLGAIGGPLTLFKGLAQMAELLETRSAYGTGQVLLIIAVKLVALAVAAAAGFRGGHIFPAVFIGVAAGILANLVLPGVPLTLCVAAGVLGLVLAISRDGWIALFLAVIVTGSIALLPLMCLAVLPAWLLVSKAPPMIIAPPPPPLASAPAAP